MQTNSTPEREYDDIELMQMSDDELVGGVQRSHSLRVKRQLLDEVAKRYVAQHAELLIRGELLDRVVQLAQAHGFEQNGWIDSIHYLDVKLDLLHKTLIFAAKLLTDDEELSWKSVCSSPGSVFGSGRTTIDANTPCTSVRYPCSSSKSKGERRER